MRVKNTVSIPGNIKKYIADDFLRLIGTESPNEVYIATLEPESLELISRFNVNIVINNFYQPCIDDSCIYLPSKTGQILVLDKFSGELVSTINLGSNYIMSDILQTQDRIFCVAAVPINTKLKLNLNRYCVFIFDKSDYSKLVQTSYFTGPPSFLSIHKNFLYAAGKDQLCKFDMSGEMNVKVNIRLANIPLLHTESCVLCCDGSGIVKILNCDDLSSKSVIKGKPMESCPAVTSNNKIVWFAKNGICQIDIDKQVSSYFSVNSVFSSPKILLAKGHLFGCDQGGSITSFDLENSSIQIIKLTNGVLREPVMAENYLFALSDDKLHHIEIK